MKGILGRKIGMTQVFTTDGTLIPVTIVSVTPNVVTQIKTKETDGYEAIQLGFEDIKEKNSNKAKMGHTKKANTNPKRFLKEIRGIDISGYSLGQEVKADIFTIGEMVDVTGISKGKGTQGVIKRYNQTRGPMGHGSQYHRGVGSLGTMLTMRVLPGKKMPGHMGSERITVQNLEVVAIDADNSCILIKGNVPGPKKSLVVIKTASKNPDKVNPAAELVKYADKDATKSEEVAEETTTEEVVTEETNETADTEKVEA